MIFAFDVRLQLIRHSSIDYMKTWDPFDEIYSGRIHTQPVSPSSRPHSGLDWPFPDRVTCVKTTLGEYLEREREEIW